MEKRINNKRYNTDTARCVGSWDNGRRSSDFNYFREVLYQKNSGEFFLYGKGGPKSCYAEYCNGLLCDGEKIMLMTREKAQKWAEEHLSADEYEATFGEVSDDDTDKVFTVRLPASTVEKVKRAAYDAGITISAYVDSKLNN